jgi:catechol 2,3-dioxygenase-like lactoylglutathione lyase family enzyme
VLRFARSGTLARGAVCSDGRPPAQRRRTAAVWRSDAASSSVHRDDHLAIPVRDQNRSRHFYETYFGFDARPARRYDDDVLMLYNANGFAFALGPTHTPIVQPNWMHFGVALRDREAVLALRDRLVADCIELVEQWDEPEYVSSKCRDPDGYIVEAAWEARH